MIFRRERRNNFRYGDSTQGIVVNIRSRFHNCAPSSAIGAHRLLKTNIARLPRNDRNEWIGVVEANRNGPTRVARDAEHLSTVDETMARRSPPVARGGGAVWAMNRPRQRSPASGPLRRRRREDGSLRRSPPRWMSWDIASTPPPPTQFHTARPRWHCAIGQANRYGQRRLVEAPCARPE